MTTVQRYDFSELQAKIDEDGFLHDSPVVGRVGVQTYRNADGSVRRELRLPEDVFHADSLASMRGKPITVDHPKSKKVTAKDATRVTVGSILSEGRADGDAVRTDLVIHAPQSMGDRRQLSLGYSCKCDETPGVHPQYGAYDAIQRDIRINHLSVVRSARAGAIARLNIDGNEEIIDFPTTQEQQTMTVKVNLDGLEYDAAPEVSRELDKLRADAAASATKLNAVTDEKTKLQARVDALQAEVDGAQAKIDAAQEAGRQAALARMKLEEVAKGFKVDCADKTDRQVKEAVIKAVRADADLTDKSDVYVDAAYDISVSMKSVHADASQRQAVNKTDAGGNQPLTSRQKYEQHMAQLAGKEG